MRLQRFDELSMFGWVLGLAAMAGCAASAAAPGSGGSVSRSRATSESMGAPERDRRDGPSDAVGAIGHGDPRPGLGGRKLRRSCRSGERAASSGCERSNPGATRSPADPLDKARALVHDGRLEVAAKILEGLVRVGLEDDRAFAAATLLGRLLVSQRRYEKARRLAGRMEQARPADPAGALLKSRVEELLGHAGRALRAAQKAVQIASHDPVALRRFAETLLAYGKPVRAAKAARRALAVQPDSAWTLVILGDALWARRRYGEAAEVYRKAASATGDGRAFRAQALDRLGTLYQNRRKTRQAKAILARCRREFPRLGCPFTEAGFMRPDPTRPERRETYAVPRGRKRRMEMGGET